MLTLKEFVALPENEREERFQELSGEDRAFVRLHEAQGATIPGEKLTAAEMLATIEEDEKLLGISLKEIKENLKS